MSLNQPSLMGDGARKFSVAKQLPPEDIRVGDFVARSKVLVEFASFLWCGADTTVLPPEQAVKVSFFPYCENTPLKVVEICLPFVLCKKLDGSHELLDIRVQQLVKLDERFAKQARKALRANFKAKGKRKKK